MGPDIDVSTFTAPLGAPRLVVTVFRYGSAATVVVDGEVSLRSVLAFRAAVSRTRSAHVHRYDLDFRKVTAFDVAGIDVLTDLAEEVSWVHDTIVIHGPITTVRDLLVESGLTPQVIIER